MTYIGKSVYNIWDAQGIRFGSVVDEKMDGSWKFLLVEWVNDDNFTQSKKEATNPKEAPNYPNWYRVDNIKVFKPEEMISSLRKL